MSDCQSAVAGQDIVIHAAGKVGGIEANRTKPGEFFYQNALMGMNLLEAARLAKVEKFVQIGTVCSYPKHIARFPYHESDLWNGYPEETNAPYGLAKKALLTMGQSYRSQYGINIIHLLLVNMYGPGDHFGSIEAHVIPSLVDRFYKAHINRDAEIVCWGTGSPTRDFLYVEDAAAAIAMATERYNQTDPINITAGREISIEQLAATIARHIGYQGQIVWDISKPDGQPRRLFDTTLANKTLGWQTQTSFDQGLKNTINWYIKHIAPQNVSTPASSVTVSPEP